MTNEEKVEELKRQILEKRAGSFRYQGHPRTYCPHMLGVANDGRVVVHAFQFGGGSSKGPVTAEKGAWRFFYVGPDMGDVSEVARINTVPSWYPESLAKSDQPYQPPKFIAKVIAVVEFGEV